MYTGQLVVIAGSTINLNQIFLISETTRLLGRSCLCHFRLFDVMVSSLHCQVEYQKGKVWIRDLLSANGVFVGEELVDEKSLSHQDRIRLGNTILEFMDTKEKIQGKNYVEGNEEATTHFSLKTNIAPPDPNLNHKREETQPSTQKRLPLGRLIKNTRDINIGRLAIKNRLLTHTEIRNMLRIQEEELSHGRQFTLAELFASHNLLSSKTMESLLLEHKYLKFRTKDIQFGQAVIEWKMAKEEEVNECLEIQDKYFQEKHEIQRVGEIMVQKGFLSLQNNNRLVQALRKKKQEEL